VLLLLAALAVLALPSGQPRLARVRPVSARGSGQGARRSVVIFIVVVLLVIQVRLDIGAMRVRVLD
jgi:hypothetical protein